MNPKWHAVYERWLREGQALLGSSPEDIDLHLLHLKQLLSQLKAKSGQLSFEDMQCEALVSRLIELFEKLKKELDSRGPSGINLN